MRSLMPIFLVLLLASSGALGQTDNASFDDHIASALQSLVANSSASTESYRFFMDMEQKIELVNLSKEDHQQIYSRSIGFGMANMTDRALKLSLASLTYDEDDVANSSTIAIEEYLINDTIYMKLDGNWTALKMPSVADAWSQQNTLEQQLNMFNQSHLTLEGSEMVEDENCYKIRAEMDISTIADQLSKETSSIMPLAGMNYTDLFNYTTLEATYWITKDAHQLKKTEVVQIFTLSPSSLGLNDTDAGELEMRINSRVTMLFQGYNESIAIELPAEAEKAQLVPIFMASVEAVPVVISGNETTLNATVVDTLKNQSDSDNSTVQAAIPT
ncbi:MAG: hypothetical protein LUQ59_04575 [Methanothrix sp.]|nr:hypothetical protein [Methanothrix sp.]